MKKIAISLFVCLLITSCSTYTKQECVTMDQTQMGYKDGINGVSSFNNAVYLFQSTCQKDYEIPVSVEKIKQGWEDGVRFYCSSNGGARAGAQGLEYSGICAKSKEDEKKFFESYNPARMSFLENKVKELERDNENLKTNADSYYSRLNSCESTVSSLQSEVSSAQSRAAACR